MTQTLVIRVKPSLFAGGLIDAYDLGPFAVD